MCLKYCNDFCIKWKKIDYYPQIAQIELFKSICLPLKHLLKSLNQSVSLSVQMQQLKNNLMFF